MVGIPEELDGLGMGDAAAAAVHLELGRGLAGSATLTTLLAIDAVCNSDLADKSDWIGTLISGESATATLAAESAAYALVWTADKQLLALVDLNQSGITRTERKLRDETRTLSDITFDGVNLNEQTVLATDDKASRQIKRLIALRDYALAADSIGAASRLLELTVEHLNTRIQFPRPLAMFQALKHRCADMKTAIVACEAMLLDALASNDAQSKAIGAKQMACQTFVDVAEDCLQLHGGIGMADEHPCHLFLKRALLNKELGSQESYEQRIAEQFLAAL